MTLRRPFPPRIGLPLLAAAAALTSCGSSGSSAPGVAVSIAPREATLGLGASLQFGAAVSGSADTSVVWSIQESSGCGAVTQAGLYSAPSTGAVCHVVVASHADPTGRAVATVTVVEGGGAAAWRPFSADSPWNTPIPPSPALEGNSTTLVRNFIDSSPYGPHLDVNIAGYSIPLYWADASTASSPVLAAIGGEGWMGWPATASMPIPAGAAPDRMSDHHMLVIDEARTVEWGCWDMSYSAGGSPQWRAGLCATSDLTGTGVRVAAPDADPWYAAHGARACGFPLVAGLIRIEEIEAGQIDHALVVAYPGILKDRFRSPASTPSAIGVASGGVPCGGRLQYDPGVDVTTLGLSRAGQIVLRALQVYGAYVGDYSGALSLYAENSPAAQAYWANVLDMYALDGIDLTKLRVLQLGTLR